MTTRRWVAGLMMLIGTTAGTWAQATKPGRLDSVLAEMDAGSAKFQSAQADVTKLLFEKIVSDTTRQTGTVYFLRKGAATEMGARFDPPSSQIVSYKDGLFQMYNPGTNHIQEFSTKGSDAAKVETYLTLGFGGSGKDLAKSWTIADQGTESIPDGGKAIAAEKLDLVSKDPGVRNNFSHITIWVDPVRDISLKQEFFTPSGDTQTAVYTNIRLNQPIDTKAYAIKCKGKCS